MKSITFRPLRRIKKTGKIVVASYMQWRKVKSADYSQFALSVVNEYSAMPPDEYVHNHEGELLFWFNHTDPEALLKNYPDLDFIRRALGREMDGEEWKFADVLGQGFHWSVQGFDCDGVPVFSHYTANYIANGWSDMEQFEPLTVAMVTKWFGWFLWQLNNSRLKVGK